MIVRLILSFCFLIFCASCEFLEKKLPAQFGTDTIDTIVNYTRVDQHPVFPKCKDLINTDEKNRCFINQLYNHIAQDLLKDTYGVSNCVNETIIVNVKIDADGSCQFLKIESSDQVQYLIPRLEKEVKKSIARLPELLPAIKRGIPVSTVYQIPVVVKLK